MYRANEWKTTDNDAIQIGDYSRNEERLAFSDLRIKIAPIFNGRAVVISTSWC